MNKNEKNEGNKDKGVKEKRREKKLYYIAILRV